MEVMEPLINAITQIILIAFPVAFTMNLIEKLTSIALKMILGKDF